MSSILAAVDTLDLTPDWQANLESVQSVIVVAFATEFFARWYASFQEKGVVRYLAQPLVLVDLLVVSLPLALPMMAGTSQSLLINLRLLRILRLQRVLSDLETFRNFHRSPLGLPKNNVRATSCGWPVSC